MDTRLSRSPSTMTAESDLRTTFLDTVEAQWPGSTRIVRVIQQHDEWLMRKSTDGVSWYDIITESMNSGESSNEDGFIYDETTEDNT
jgi:hypothetical protein